MNSTDFSPPARFGSDLHICWLTVMNFPSLYLKHLLSPAAKCNRSVDFKDARQFRWLRAWGKIGNFNFAKFHSGPVWAIRSITRNKRKHCESTEYRKLTLGAFQYVRLDKAKIPSFTRFKASTNVTKYWQKPSFGRRKESQRWKHWQDFGHVLGNQIPSHVSSYIRQVSIHKVWVQKFA